MSSKKSSRQLVPGFEEVFMIEEMYVNRKAFPSWNFRLSIFELYLPNFRISLEKVGNSNLMQTVKKDQAKGTIDK